MEPLDGTGAAPGASLDRDPEKTKTRTRVHERIGDQIPHEMYYGEFYDRDLRIDAVMVRYSSPYPGVRAVAEIMDDSSTPTETARAYFLAISSYKTPGFLLLLFFMYWLPRRRLAWWEKYNYVLSAALAADVAVGAVVIFFAVQDNPVELDW
ncbi:hypothetical protein MYCTH_2110752 [Thermothelomyces thermophilus ATCC 42464]|uniref:Uncharacterized protein n=1 Tax=Thermothelomyces thermophilus (strain ATCC 42464 / BCRC 31852 / DSM 1799) TaxID=573729 RepID=G2QFR8_THET4|nr:uncharacterized protein MYCTH_2110752 [Thermothelomyces thermophilus ATCC 42464]AEO58436.1 hypothetical protein MYCTH_2110752 [Thermothelomyces thermophilus ATCC 42464]